MSDLFMTIEDDEPEAAVIKPAKKPAAKAKKGKGKGKAKASSRNRDSDSEEEVPQPPAVEEDSESDSDSDDFNTSFAFDTSGSDDEAEHIHAWDLGEARAAASQVCRSHPVLAQAGPVAWAVRATSVVSLRPAAMGASICVVWGS
jgi:hypothetical protein